MACHLTYTRSRRCRHAPERFSTYTDTCKHQYEPCSAPQVVSVVKSRSLSTGLHQIHVSVARKADGSQSPAPSAPSGPNPPQLKLHCITGTSYTQLGPAIMTGASTLIRFRGLRTGTSRLLEQSLPQTDANRPARHQADIKQILVMTCHSYVYFYDVFYPTWKHDVVFF